MIRLNSDLVRDIVETAKKSDEGKSVFDAIMLLHNGQIIAKTLADQKDDETLEAIDAAITDISLCVAKKAETITGFANMFLTQMDESFHGGKNEPSKDFGLYRKVNRIKDAVRESAKSAGLLIRPEQDEWRMVA